jgi:hypothetical protein
MAQFYNQYKSEHITEHITDTTAISIHQAQQKIYNFFLEIIKHNRPEEILNQFDRLFIKYEEIPDLNVYYALGEIIFHNREHEFKNTLLRCCYILNNNWALNGKINSCHQLVELFLSDSIAVPTRVSRLKTLKQWLRNFAQSEEYQTLRSLLGRSRVHKNYHNWSDRFSSYLLTSEYVDFNKSPEQRQYAETLSRKLKKQFKFDLAMYTARLGSSSGTNPQRQNPTTLGDGVLMLIKKVLNKQGSENFRNTAKNFNKQIRYLTFWEFKENLLEYLGISKDDLEIPEVMRVTVVQKLKHLQENDDDRKMTISFLHVACNRVLQYLLLNERRSPSEFLMLSLEYNNYLNPVILLLKTVLICPSSRLYLESYIAELIKFYSSYSEIECQSFINFVDVLNVTLAIFDEDTNYSLIKMQNNPNNTNNLPDVNLESYRIFSQSKRLADLRIAPAKSDTTRSLHPLHPSV